MRISGHFKLGLRPESKPLFCKLAAAGEFVTNRMRGICAQNPFFVLEIKITSAGFADDTDVKAFSTASGFTFRVNLNRLCKPKKTSSAEICASDGST